MTEREKTELESIIATIESQLSGAIQGREESYGDLVLIIKRGQSHDVLKLLRQQGFNLLLDIAGIDLLKIEHVDRFQVVYNLYSLSKDLRLRLKINVPEADMNVPSVVDLWEAANWAEREAFDMFGINFEGHPNLARILCHREFEGHALRKDYPIMKGQWATGTSNLMPDLERE